METIFTEAADSVRCASTLRGEWFVLHHPRQTPQRLLPLQQLRHRLEASHPEHGLPPIDPIMPKQGLNHVGRSHVRLPIRLTVHLVCRLLLEKKNQLAARACGPTEQLVK